MVGWRAVLTVVVVLASAACGGGDAAPGTALRVALVTPGPVSDAGWNAAAYAGLKEIERRLGARTAHVEAGGPAEFEESFRDFAGRGYTLVIGHGFEFQDAALAVGAEFPDTAFVITSGLAVADNVAGLVFRLEEAAYLAGVLAAGMSRSGTVGMVGGMEIPPVRLVFDGFEAGFLTARPDGVVKEIYLGSWEDVASARQATLALLAQGADLVIHNADAAGLGVFQACREKGAWAVGTNSDQAAVAPDVVLASAVLDIPEAMVQVAEAVVGGEFRGQVYRFDLASGVVRLAVNPEHSDAVPDALAGRLEDIRQQLLRGEVELEHFGG